MVTVFIKPGIVVLQPQITRNQCQDSRYAAPPRRTGVESGLVELRWILFRLHLPGEVSSRLEQLRAFVYGCQRVSLNCHGDRLASRPCRSRRQSRQRSRCWTVQRRRGQSGTWQCYLTSLRESQAVGGAVEEWVDCIGPAGSCHRRPTAEAPSSTSRTAKVERIDFL